MMCFLKSIPLFPQEPGDVNLQTSLFCCDRSSTNDEEELDEDGISTSLTLSSYHQGEDEDRHRRRRLGVSTTLLSSSSRTEENEEKGIDDPLLRLSLSIGPPRIVEHKWRIIKKLYKSDVDQSSRLLLKKKEVEVHILPFLKEEERRSLSFDGTSTDGIKMRIFDVEKDCGFALTLKKWKTGSFVLTSNWGQDFVRRRGLVENDEIGLYFDQHNSRLCFGVVTKAPPPVKNSSEEEAATPITLERKRPRIG